MWRPVNTSTEQQSSMVEVMKMSHGEPSTRRRHSEIGSVDVLMVDDNDAVIISNHIGPILAESKRSLPAVSTNLLIYK